jgi:hypothetical protein
MYEQSEEFARLYEALVTFQTRAIGYSMTGENTEERIERARFVAGVIERASYKLDKRCPQPIAFALATHCGQGLINCGGVCVDPKACWGRVGGVSELASTNDPNPKA